MGVKNMTDITTKALGYCWVKGQRRPFYKARPIRRGKDKGKMMVEYRHSVFKTKHVPVDESSLRWLEDHPMPTPDEKEEDIAKDQPRPKMQQIELPLRHKKGA
jgi:hypothetical protein